MINISDKPCRENENTVYVQLRFPSNRSVCEIMWKTFVETGQATVDIIIERMRIACWIPEATNTHSEHLKLISFPLQQ
jgi:hypothetical protein